MLQEFKNLLDFQKVFGTEAKCVKYLVELRWQGCPKCPRCGKQGKGIYILKKLGLFMCGKCNRQFGIRFGTIFEDSPLPLVKWFTAIYLEVSRPKGISSCQLAKDIGVWQDTAWFMLQRVRWAVSHQTIEKMDGDVCVDETFVGGKEGNKHKNKRKPRVLGDSPKMVVVGIASKTKIAMKYITKLNIKHIKPVLERHIDFDNVELRTDESPLYKGYKREVVCHSRGEYGRGGISTNRIEGVFSHFKRMIFGVFHQISADHIDKYIGGFCFRHNNRDLHIQDKFSLAMNLMFNKKLMYCDLVNYR